MEGTTYKQTVYGGLFAADWEVIGNIDRLLTDIQRGANRLYETREELSKIKECPRKELLKEAIPILEANVKGKYSEMLVWSSRLKSELELPARCPHCNDSGGVEIGEGGG